MINKEMISAYPAGCLKHAAAADTKQKIQNKQEIK
jgi:hypothetical protein